MKTVKSILVIAMIAGMAVVACKKGKNEGPGSDGPGSYTYKGQTVKITKGEYNVADNAVSVFLLGDGFTDGVTYYFANYGTTVPTGTFTLSSGTYNPTSNFSAAYLNSGEQGSGGKITISKSGDGYSVTFELITADGTAKGNYTGSMTKR